MERKRILVALIASGALWVVAESAVAQPPAPPGAPAAGRPGRGDRAFGPARQRWREMSSEDRQRFKSNAERWLRMAPEERRVLREQEGFRRQRIRREADAALEQSGLQLEAEKRELYERRYLQERRRIERGLRQELEQRRQRELAPVMENLKKEFSEQPKNGSPASTAAPASPAPSQQR